jgi:hypothetical protein
MAAIKVPLRVPMQAAKVPSVLFKSRFFARFLGKKVARTPFFYSRPDSIGSLSLTQVNDGGHAAAQ